MATDLETRPDEDQDAIQRHYDDAFSSLTSPGHMANDGVSGDIGNDDDVFNDLTSAEHMAKDGVSGDIGGDESGFFRDESTPKAKGDDETPAKSESKKDESSTSGGDSGLFSGDEGSRQKKRFGLSRRQWSITGGVFGLGFGGGGLILLSTLVGPFQAFNYSSILTKPQASQTSAMGGRLSKAYRYAKTGDIGETRLTAVGSYFYGKAQVALAKEGITTTNGITGVKTVEFDVSKNGKYSGLSPGEAAQKFKADNPGVKITSLKDGKFTADVTRMKIGDVRNFIKGYVAESDLGWISKQLAMRGMAKAFGAPSWFHPLTRLSQAADRRIAVGVNRLRASQDEDSRLKKLMDKSQKIKDFNDSVRGRLKPSAGKAVGGALIATAAICAARDTAQEIPKIDQYNVIIPSIKAAGDAIGIGQQVASGRDIDLFAVGAAVDKYEDSTGKSVWQSEGVQKLEDPSSKGGKQIDPGMGQAFSPDSSATNVVKTMDAFGAGTACSTGGKIVQGVVGAVLWITGAGGAVEKLVQAGIGVAVGVGIGYLSDYVAHVLADDPISATVHQGPDGGNTDAYGALALASASARQQGGTQLSASQTAVLMQQQEKADAQEFASKSLVARVFDARDYRSLAGKFIDSQSPSAANNVSSMFSGTLNIFSNLGHMFSSLSSVFTPKASAATATNGWFDMGFNIPQYGFSDSDLNSTLVDDPYVNADKVAELYKNGTIDGTMQDHIQTCFGVQLYTDSDGKLDVKPADDSNDNAGQDGEGGPNPASGAYQGADCGNTSDTWTRIRFFIMDIAAVKSAACYEGDGQSCLDLGVTQPSTGTNVCTGTATPGTIPSWSVMPDVSSQPIGGAVSGKVSMAIANIRSSDTFAHNLGVIGGNSPDFIGLQEVDNESLQHMEDSAPGYGAYRDSTPDTDVADNGSSKAQETGDAIMWRKDTWTFLAGGRVKVTNHDHVVFEGNNQDWNRYAVWGMFKRNSDGAIVSFISTHMMTDPSGQKQWGTLDPPMTRIEQYALSMQNLKQLVGVLSAHGPVLLGGDMNVAAGNTNNWAPAPQMKAIGYGVSGDGRVLLSFNPQGTTVADNKIVNLELHGDHNDGSIQTTINMNGVGPGAFTGSLAASGCTSTGTGGDLRVASYNAEGAGHAPDYKGRMDKFINIIQKQNLDVVGLQELEGTGAAQRNYLLQQLSANGLSYGIYGDASKQNAIIYNTEKVSFVSGDHEPNVKYYGGDAYIPYALLKNTQTGQQFYFMDTHEPANKYACPGGCGNQRDKNADLEAAFVTNLAKKGLPIIFAGDFNSKYDIPGEANTPGSGDRNDMPYCTLTDNNLMVDSFDAKNGVSGHCPTHKWSPDDVPKDGDHIFMTPDIKVTDYIYEPKGSTSYMAGGESYDGSDHPIVIAGITLPGSPTADSSGSTTPPFNPVSPGDPAIKIHTPALLQHENVKGSPSPGKQPLYITPKGIIIHWWGGSGGIDSLYNTLKGRGLSVQFGVTSDGQIYQMMQKETSYAAHATDANSTTFGIEIEGTGDINGYPDFGARGPTNNPKKFAAVVHLVTYLVKKYHIPLTGPIKCGDVVGIHSHKQHDQVCGGGKIDVDDAYFNAIMAAVKQQPGIQ